jgi:hypothetical protein
MAALAAGLVEFESQILLRRVPTGRPNQGIALHSASPRPFQQSHENVFLSNVCVGASRMLMIDGGEIVEQVDHATLLAKGGLYARLARLHFETGAKALEQRAAE